MSLENSDMRFYLVAGIAAMLLLFISFLLIFIFTQRRKLQYHHSLQALKEAQQFQLIDAAVRSEESERHRIAEELHDEVGAGPARRDAPLKRPDLARPGNGVGPDTVSEERQ